MNRCPAEGCNKRIQESYAFCQRHWYMIPQTTRDEIWEAYNSKKRNRSLELISKAIEGIKKKEESTETGMSYAS